MNRKSFTKSWSEFSSNQKSIVISIGAIVLATTSLFAFRFVFPEYDFSQAELVVGTAMSGFIVSVIKNFVKIK